MIPQCAILAVLVLGTPVLAQTFEPRVGYRTDWDNNGTPTVDPEAGVVVPVGPGAGVELQALFGVFGGPEIRGLFRFEATLTLDDPAGTASIVSRRNPANPSAIQALRAPYSFANMVTEVSTTVIQFDANRGAGTISAPWPPGLTAEEFLAGTYYGGPGVVPGGGAPNSYHPGFRFTLMPGEDVSPRVASLTISGIMQTFTDWFFIGDDLAPANFVSSQVSLTIPIHIPAPAAALVLISGGLAVRRRRGGC